MTRNIALATCFFILGALLTASVYFYLHKIHPSFITPLSQTKFSLEKSPSESLVGSIASFSGKVSWQSRTANMPSLINSPQTVQQGEEVDTGDNGQAVVQFPNIVQIGLNKNTKIGIIQTLPANIVLEEKEGSAVYESMGGTIPISVRGLDLLINVGSGKSLISVNKENSLVTITVESGSVALAYTDMENTTQTVTARKGQKMVFNNNTKTLEF